MQDISASDLPNADGFLRRSALRVLAWIQAGLAYLHYGYLDWISQQAVPFTATAEFLEAWAALAPTPVLREAPTYATGPAAWPGIVTIPPTVLPAGTLCARTDGTQFAVVADAAVSTSSTVTATVIAVVAGSAGNTDSGAPLTLATVVPGITSAGSATGPIAGGTDVELDPAMRTRMLESYAAPPHGGNASDYVTWALAVPGVTRAWCYPNGVGGGTVVVYFMMDLSEAAWGGFPQGSNGVATAETRATAATGDQLTVANAIYPLRPVTALVYAVAPIAQPLNFTIAGLLSISTIQQAAISAALTSLLVQLDSPLGTTSIEQSDCDGAVIAVGGLPSFAITTPSAWPVTSAIGYLFTLGTVTYV
jgi:uncharacterized phage protein gp47/JayE